MIEWKTRLVDEASLLESVYPWSSGLKLTLVHLAFYLSPGPRTYPV